MQVTLHAFAIPGHCCCSSVQLSAARCSSVQFSAVLQTKGPGSTSQCAILCSVCLGRMARSAVDVAHSRSFLPAARYKSPGERIRQQRLDWIVHEDENTRVGRSQYKHLARSGHSEPDFVLGITPCSGRIGKITVQAACTKWSFWTRIRTRGFAM